MFGLHTGCTHCLTSHRAEHRCSSLSIVHHSGRGAAHMVNVEAINQSNPTICQNLPQRAHVISYNLGYFLGYIIEHSNILSTQDHVLLNSQVLAILYKHHGEKQVELNLL